MNKYMTLLVSVVTIMGMQSCQRTLPEETTDLVLARCLTPTGLDTEIENDADVLFSWVTRKDADSYSLIVSADKDYTDIVRELSVPVSEVPYRLTLEPGEYYYKVQAVAEDREVSAWAYCTKSFRIIPPPMDISVNGTANCYIVSQAGSYKFKATRGCTDVAVEDISSVEVLWETSVESDGASLSEGTVVDGVNISGGYVNFVTPAVVKPGNALIAAKNADGKILWSWHVWITADEVKDVDLGGGLVLMDRNIGELTSSPGTSMLYQWGRKDPFPGTDGKGKAVSVAGAGTEYINASLSNVDRAAAPTTIYGPLSNAGAEGYGNLRTEDLWGEREGKKTENDPCPAGYRVPHILSADLAKNKTLGDTRMSMLSALILDGDVFKMSLTDGNTVSFGSTGYYLLNTVENGSRVGSSQLNMGAGMFFLWTADHDKSRQAGCVYADAGGIHYAGRASTDATAEYQSKFNAYAVRCEKIAD